MLRGYTRLCCFILFSQISLLSFDAVDVAIQQLGKPYILGAAGPDAFDCSGLTQFAYKQVGINIPKYSGDQATTFGSMVSPPFQRGDLLFFWTKDDQPGVVSHVGIYESNNSMIDAEWYIDQYGSKVAQVKRADVTSSYWAPRFLFARRATPPAVDVITFGFTGVVTHVFDNFGVLGSTVAVGTTLSGTFSYDTGAEYDGSFYSQFSGSSGISILLNTSAGTRTVAIGAQNLHVLVLNDDAVLGDWFRPGGIWSSATWQLPVLPSKAFIGIELIDQTAPLDLLTSTALPTSLDLQKTYQATDGTTQGLSYLGSGDIPYFYQINFRLTNLVRIQ